MDSGGTLVDGIDQGVGGTSISKTISTQWNNRDLYWGVKAANAQNANWSVRRFRIQPGSGNCPQDGGVILYWNANYNCDNDQGDAGFRQRNSAGLQNVNDGQFNDRASSVKVQSGWSVRLFNDAGGSGGNGSICYNSSVGDFGTQGNFPGTSFPINDKVSSMDVFQTPNCSNGNPLPSDYGYCSDEGQACTFSGSAQIYYGANNQLIGPVTKTDGVLCSNDIFTDPIPGTQKKCYIKGGRPQSSIFCANEGSTCSFGSTSVATVYYGANGKYNTKTGVVSSILCDNNNFPPDPFSGIGKACYYVITGSNISTPSNPSPADNTTLSRTNDTYLSWNTSGTSCTIDIQGGTFILPQAIIAGVCI